MAAMNGSRAPGNEQVHKQGPGTCWSTYSMTNSQHSHT